MPEAKEDRNIRAPSCPADCAVGKYTCIGESKLLGSEGKAVVKHTLLMPMHVNGAIQCATYCMHILLAHRHIEQSGGVPDGIDFALGIVHHEA